MTNQNMADSDMLEPATAGLENPTSAPKPISVLILGIGKSGTTALMTAISQSLRIPYEMEPRDLGQLDYQEAFVAKKLIDMIKDNELKYIRNFDKVIFIVRDPRDSLVSRLLYRPFGLKIFAKDWAVKGYLELIERKIRDPKSVSVRALLTRLRQISGHQTLNSVFGANQRLLRIHKSHGQNAMLLKYEDFISYDFAQIAEYLGVGISNEFNVDKKYERVSRKGARGDWKDWFTAADCKYFDQQFQEFYTTFGYAPEPPSTHPVIDRRTSIDYTQRVVNEWRERRGIAPYNPRFERIRDIYARRRKLLKTLRKSVHRIYARRRKILKTLRKSVHRRLPDLIKRLRILAPRPKIGRENFSDEL